MFGLAVTSGFISHAGIAGLTLGGGIGHLMRKFGLSVDALLSCDVVTAGGELVVGSEAENPDLFWVSAAAVENHLGGWCAVSLLGG